MPPKPTKLSTGSSLLNLACSGSTLGGLLPGKYYLLVGDSAAGKTFLCMNILAEAAKAEAFEDYDLIYDNVEDGMLMNVERMFGKSLAKRLRPPAKDEDGEPTYSTTIEEFYYHVDDAVQEERPFIYILDSMDSLSSDDEGKKFDQHKKAHRTGKDAPGSYGDGKAKKNSSGLRKLVKAVRESGSVLLIVAQTRDVLNAGPWQETRTRSGGRALTFYATLELWMNKAGVIKKTVRGKPRKIGNKVRIQVKKNRITGKLADIQTAIYHSYGLDDVGSCIDYLLEEKWWKKKAQKITAGAFGLVSRDKIIRECEDEAGMKKLRQAVFACWKEVETESALSRKPRYD